MSSVKYLFYLIVILASISISCTEKFHPEIDSKLSILVVDGKITNEVGSYEVRLFRTVDLIEVDTLKPETGAVIILNDDLGNRELLEEVKPGIYQTVNQEIKGKIGQSYWINIKTKTGENYESTPEKMPPPYNIQDIYAKEEVNIINATEKQKVVNFYFDAEANSTDANYIRWEYRESYEWRAPEDLNTVNLTNKPSKICFPVTIFPLISIYDASNHATKFISKQATTTINTYEVKLLYEYLLDITLYSTTQDNYKFWQNIKSVNFSEGALYDVLAANIKGNIQECNDACQVIGYFQAASVDKLQKFYSDDDFSLEFSKYPKECERIKMRMDIGIPDPKQFHIISKEPVEGRGTLFIVRRNECYECNVVHPTNKPSFWP